jgi:hypothetical protein
MISKHCTNLELSKELKALGVPQKSEFYWIHVSILPDVWRIGKSGKEKYSAFLSSELGEMLEIKYLTGICFLRDKEKWSWVYIDKNDDDVEVFAETEADARAKMLCYLLKNKIYDQSTKL